MDIEKRRSLFLIIILGTLVAFSLALFVWQKFLNFGKVNFIGEYPFTVEVYEGNEAQCLKDPCIIKGKRGNAIAVIKKEGHLDVIKNFSFRLWKTDEQAITFYREPYLTRTTSTPEQEESPSFELGAYGANQPFFNSESPENIITTFPSPIEKSLIFGGKTKALILDVSSPGEGYVVNVLSGTKEKFYLPELAQISEAKWSPSGNFMLFKTSQESPFFVMTSDYKIIELSVKTNWDLLDWNNLDQLVLVTNQIVSGTSKAELQATIQENSYSFMIFEPEIQEYQLLKTYDNQDIKTAPSGLVTNGNSSEIHFRSGEENFKIILK